MKFRTVIDAGKAPFRLDPSRPTLWLGSCFTDNIGSRLKECMSPATVNPCGVQYNPESMAQLIGCALSDSGLPSDSIFYHDGLWRCWLMPSAFASPDRGEAEEKAAQALCTLADRLKNAQALFVTFGTAQVYEHYPSSTSSFNAVVSNCHKVPSSEFRHTLLPVGTIVDRWNTLVNRIRGLNPDLKIVYTVSPVRHLNPSPRLNTLSKSTLHLAADSLVDNDREGSFYFAAWELLMDDLRDYRFYGADLTHPSEQAVDYIWENFCRCFYSESDIRVIDEGASIVRRLAHRRMTANLEADRRFRDKSLQLAAAFVAAHPGMTLKHVHDFSVHER